MSAKPRAPSKPLEKPPEVGRWRIMRGDVEIASFMSEELARLRWHSYQQSIAGQGARLVRPDGKDD